MSIQFDTQHLLQEIDEYDSLRSMLAELGASLETVEMLVSAVKKGILEPSIAVNIVKQTTGNMKETSATGGGTTAGASFTPGAGEQVATTKAFKKRQYQEDAPRLAGDPTKTNKQGTKNLTAYKNFGFTKAPSAEEAAKDIKGVEVKSLWEEEVIEEGRAYSQFKKQTAIRPKNQQMHEAVKAVDRRLQEVNKILEYVSQLRTELSEGETVFEYTRHTRSLVEKMKKRVAEAYSKLKSMAENSKPSK